MSDFNCHVELLLEQPGVNGMSSGIGINVVVGPNWFQVNRADKQCAGHCTRLLSNIEDLRSLPLSGMLMPFEGDNSGDSPNGPPVDLTPGFSRRADCWLTQLYPACEIEQPQCPKFELMRGNGSHNNRRMTFSADMQVAIVLSEKHVSLNGLARDACLNFNCGGASSKINEFESKFKLGGAGGGAQGCVRVEDIVCRPQVPYNEPAYTCAMTTKLGSSLFGATSSYVATVGGTLLFVVSLALNLFIFFLMSGSTLQQLLVSCYRRMKYGNIGVVGDQGTALRPRGQDGSSRFRIGTEEGED